MRKTSKYYNDTFQENIQTVQQILIRNFYEWDWKNSIWGQLLDLFRFTKSKYKYWVKDLLVPVLSHIHNQVSVEIIYDKFFRYWIEERFPGDHVKHQNTIWILSKWVTQSYTLWESWDEIIREYERFGAMAYDGTRPHKNNNNNIRVNVYKNVDDNALLRKLSIGATLGKVSIHSRLATILHLKKQQFHHVTRIHHELPSTFVYDAKVQKMIDQGQLTDLRIRFLFPISEIKKKAMTTHQHFDATLRDFLPQWKTMAKIFKYLLFAWLMEDDNDIEINADMSLCGNNSGTELTRYKANRAHFYLEIIIKRRELIQPFGATLSNIFIQLASLYDQSEVDIWRIFRLIRIEIPDHTKYMSQPGLIRHKKSVKMGGYHEINPRK